MPYVTNSRFELEPSDIAITHDRQRLGLVQLLNNMHNTGSEHIRFFADQLQLLIVPELFSEPEFEPHIDDCTENDGWAICEPCGD